jgi:hypothetical protein
MPIGTTQVKFTIDSDTVAAFKARCARENVSMTSVIRKFMKSGKQVKNVKVKTHTRPMRRKAVQEIIDLLSYILANEEVYRDTIPEQFSQRIEAADHACEQLSDSIASLEEAFKI